MVWGTLSAATACVVSAPLVVVVVVVVVCVAAVMGERPSSDCGWVEDTD